MTNVDLAALWAQIKQRNDILAVSDLHYIKLKHPSQQRTYLLTWEKNRNLVTVSSVYMTNDLNDLPVEVSDYFYIVLKDPHPRKQVLIRVDKDGDELKFSEVLTPAKNSEITFRYLSH